MWRPIALVLALLVAVAASAAPVRAQDRAMTPASVALAEEVARALEAVPFEDRAAVYETSRPVLAAAAETDPVLAGLLLALDTQNGAVLALDGASRGIQALQPGTAAADWRRAVKHIVAGLAESADTMPPTPRRLDELYTALERFTASGGSANADATASPEITALLALVLEIGHAGLSTAELEERGRTEFQRYAARVGPLLTAAPGPLLALVEIDEWNVDMWRAATGGIDVAADALAHGAVDPERLAVVTDAFVDVAEAGPLGGRINVGYLRRWAGEVPVVGRLVVAGWPAEGPEVDDPDVCNQIDCDCDNLTLDTGGAFRTDCVATEDALRAECRATGAIMKTCHPTASGPAAYPPG